MNMKKSVISKDIQKFHKSVELSSQIFNRIALNPFEKVSIPKIFYSGLPISWNLTQIYHILNFLYEKIPFQHVFFMFVDKSLQLLDGFLFHIEQILDEDEKKVNRSFLQSEVEFLREFEERDEFILKLQEIMYQKQSIAPFVNEYFSKNYGFEKVYPFIIPWSIKSDIASLNLPSFNTNTLLAISRILSWKNPILKGFQEESNNDIYYFLSQNIKNPKIFQTIKKWIISWNNVDLQQWSTIITTLLDDLTMNFVLVSNDHKNLLFGVKMMVDHNQMKLTALPNHIFKDLLTPEKSLLDIGKNIYKKTGIRTAILETQDFWKYFTRFRNSDMGMFEFLTSLFELVFSATYYPDSLLNSFLKLFGLELGSGITEISNAFKTMTRYFGNILIVTYQDNIKDENKPYEALAEMKYDGQNYSMKLLNTADYKELFRTSPTNKFTRLKIIKEGIEKAQNTHYSCCFGFNIDLFSEYLSAKNIQAFLKMSDMVHQLPFIATLGALFVGMKGMHADENSAPLIHTYDEQPSEDLIQDKLEFHNYINGFLKKGMLFISDEDKSMMRIRSPEYAEQGYLGIDMEALREFIRKSEN
ncbi:MAG: hypothetical protein ACTSWC_08560 [Promethearchaeota archaeon]